VSDARLKLLYVCDFSSVHSRSLIGYFAARTDRYEVTIVSTTAASPMDGVRILFAPSPTTRGVRQGWVGRLAYRFSLLFPKVYIALREWEALRVARRVASAAAPRLEGFEPDVLHALRTQPEGIVASSLKQRLKNVPFFLSTWGQDLVVWGRGGSVIRAATERVMSVVDYLLPDNPRDERLASAEYGARPRSVLVMPATGGLDPSQDSLGDGPEGSTPLPGDPSLLSMRGYENAYVRVRVLLESMRIFVRRHPEAHLYIDGPAGHAGSAAVRRWIRQGRLDRNVSMVHLDRAGIFDAMRRTDFYVSATTSDGLPISLLEALHLGQIPIVTASESVAPPLHPGVNGVLVDRLSPDAIADGWELACSMRTNRAERTRLNREMLQLAYDRSANLSRLEGLYEAAAAETRPARSGGRTLSH
jgi:glycosyltransferase involved in cell wall biosynthesis